MKENKTLQESGKNNQIIAKSSLLRSYFLLIVIIVLILLGVGKYYFHPKCISTSQQIPQSTPIVPTVLPIKTTTWKTYTNYLYGFSFKYPSLDDKYYYSFTDTSNFQLSTDRRITGAPSGTPWLYIEWGNKNFSSEGEYINAEIARKAGTYSRIKQGTLQFGPHTFYAYSTTGVPNSIQLIMKVPNSQLFIYVYDVNFPDNVRNAVIESLALSSESPSDTLTYKNPYLEFSYPSTWALSEGLWPDYSVSVASDSSNFNAHVDVINFSDTEDFQLKADESNNYKASSTAWYGDLKLGQIGKSQINVSGHVGYKYQWKLAEPYGQTTWIYIPYAQRLFTIELAGKNSLILNQILSSFKFIEPNLSQAWYEYRHPYYGLRIQYPPTWKIIQASNSEVVFSSSNDSLILSDAIVPPANHAAVKFSFLKQVSENNTYGSKEIVVDGKTVIESNKYVDPNKKLDIKTYYLKNDSSNGEFEEIFDRMISTLSDL